MWWGWLRGQRVGLAQTAGSPELSLPRTVWGQGLLSFSSGRAGSRPAWRSSWQCDGGQSLNWPCGIVVALLAWLLHCWH